MMGTSYSPRIVTNGLLFNYDMYNKKSWCKNVFPYPLDPYALTATGNGCTLSRETTFTSPAGGTPLKMVPTSTDPHQQSTIIPISSTNIGDTWTLSVWIKADIACKCQLFILGLNSTPSFVSASNTGLFDVTTSWVRYTFTTTLSTTGTVSAAIRLDGPETGVALDGTTVPTIWFDGVQLERASSASNFNALTNTNGVNVFDLISTNNGTASNITYNSDGYYSFNGTNSIITFPNNTAFDNQAFSVEVWVKTNALSQNGFWFEKGTVNTQYSLFQGGGAIIWRAYNGAITNMVSVTTATYMNTTDWFHVVGTCISGSQVVYINGVSVGTGTTSGPFSTNNGGCSIGAYGGATGAHSYWYNGSIAIVKVYNRVLSAGEVVQNFSALRGRFGL